MPISDPIQEIFQYARTGDRRGLKKILEKQPELLNAKDYVRSTTSYFIIRCNFKDFRKDVHRFSRHVRMGI